MSLILANVRTIITWLWIAAGVVWLIGALSAKRSVRAQSATSRFFHLTLVALAFFIGFTRPFERGFLGRKFMGVSPAISLLALTLTAVGIAFAIWARLSLGANWSGTITVKHDHTLIRRGPYRVVRHPIYSGLLLAFAGTVLAIREIRGLIAFVLISAALLLKARIEERFMIEQFGTEYREYSREVKGLIPFVY